MKKPLIFGLFSSCLLLAGCSDADWDHALNYGGLGDEAPVTPVVTVTPPQQAQPAAIASAPGEDAGASFCRSVATQDATDNDFDAATQKSVFARSYAQCLTIYTR